MFCALYIVIYQHNALVTLSFISINNLYLLPAGLQFIIRRYWSVYTAIGVCRLAASRIGVEL
jgi:hypothetical protein